MRHVLDRSPSVGRLAGARMLATTFALVLLAMAPRASRAEIVYATGFETPTFTANQPVAGQDGWTSRLGSSAGTISTNTPASGQQALEFQASQLPLFGFGFNLETVRNILDFDVVAAGARGVNVAADVRLNGPGLQDDLVEAIFSATDPNFLDYGQMQISADGHVYVYGSKFDDSFVGSITRNTYHHLAMAIDFYDRETTFSVDGADIATFGFDPALQTTIFRAGSLHMAAPTDPSLADPALYSANFDNFRVDSIPEPPALALLAIGLLALPWLLRFAKAAAPIRAS